MLRDVEGFCMVSTPHLWWFYGFLLTHLLWGWVSSRAAFKAVAARFASLEPGTNKVVTVSWAATTRLDFRWFYQTYQVYPVDIFWFGARIYIDSLEKRFQTRRLSGSSIFQNALCAAAPVMFLDVADVAICCGCEDHSDLQDTSGGIPAEDGIQIWMHFVWIRRLTFWLGVYLDRRGPTNKVLKARPSSVFDGMCESLLKSWDAPFWCGTNGALLNGPCWVDLSSKSSQPSLAEFDC